MPQSKIYEVLECLSDKGFVELIDEEKPLAYKAVSLKETTEKAKVSMAKAMKELDRNMEKLNRVLETVAPIHR